MVQLSNSAINALAHTNTGIWSTLTIPKLVTLDWWKPDLIEADGRVDFIENLKTQPVDWYYRTNHVKYTINTHRYRTNEFDTMDWNNSVVVFGDSPIFGSGLDNNDTLSSQLSNMIGLNCINLGLLAIGNNIISHNLSTVLADVQPKAVVIAWTGFDRWGYQHHAYDNAWVRQVEGISAIAPKYTNGFNAQLAAGEITSMSVKCMQDSQNIIADASIPAVQCTFVDYSKWNHSAQNIIPGMMTIDAIDKSRNLVTPGRETMKLAAIGIADSLRTMNVF